MEDKVNVNRICHVCSKGIELDFGSTKEREELWDKYLDLLEELALYDDAHIPTNLIYRCPECLDNGIEIVSSGLKIIKEIHNKVYSNK